MNHINSKSYYGCINSLKKRDERVKEYKKMWKEKGFEPTETWNLDITLSKWIIPRLEYFIEVHDGHPVDLTEEEWNNILNKMLDAFKQASYDVDENTEVVEEGLNLFAKYFGHLWW